MTNIRIGTASWTDPTLIEAGTFYPSRKMSAEARLRFYARHFDMVEVDSSYYAIPSENGVGLQALRTPDDFIFHYKAYGSLTQHPVDPKKLPKAVKDLMPEELLSKRRLSNRELPDDAWELCVQMFTSALRPVYSAGKLGVVLLQFPPFFVRSDRNMEYILRVAGMLGDYRGAVEFRHPSWVAGEGATEETYSFLRENGLAYVAVDEPQFENGTTMPPVIAATTDIAYVRMHGRNTDNWFRKGLSTAERYMYLYSDAELREWAPKVRQLSQQAKETHVLFNNCYADYAVQNARRFSALLD